MMSTVVTVSADAMPYWAEALLTIAVSAMAIGLGLVLVAFSVEMLRGRFR